MNIRVTSSAAPKGDKVHAGSCSCIKPGKLWGELRRKKVLIIRDDDKVFTMIGK